MFNKEKSVQVVIDKEKCTKCGICTNACATFLTKDDDGYPTPRDNNDRENLLGCIQCGNCMMRCPKDAIEIIGEDINKEHLRELNPKLPDYDAINSLFLKRRSCREFTEQEISKEDLDKILKSAATAAVSFPPSEVKVLVIQGREKVREFRTDVLKQMEKFAKFGPFMLPIIRVTAGKSQYKMLKDLILPLSKAIVENSKTEGSYDYLLYDAPCVAVFYGSEYSDKEDWMIAATQATIAAEALGLGTCFIGAVGPILQNNPNLKKKYGFSKTDKLGTAFILGNPKTAYRKAFQRNFKQVTFY